ESLSSAMVSKLTKVTKWLERVEGVPVDIEFLIKDNIIYIVQVRPITTLDDYTEETEVETEQQEEQEEQPGPADEIADEVSFDVSDEDFFLGDFTPFRTGKTADAKKSKSAAKKIKGKKGKKKKNIKSAKTITGVHTGDHLINDDIRQPVGRSQRDVIESNKKLAHSKDSFDRSLQLNQQQIKSLLLSYGLPESWIDEIDFNEGLPEDIVSLIKNSNSQITGTTIDENKSLIENLTNSPILFSLAIETFVRVYASELNEESTLGDLLYCIEDRLNKKLYEATCVDLRGYFGEFYTANTLEAGIIFDKKVGPIIIRPNMPTESNIRGFDIYTIDGNKIQVKIGGSPIVWKHLQKYWKEVTPENEELGIINIPVITTKNVKNNSFPDDDRVQGLDITTEAVTTFAHEFVSALSGITYKKDMLSVSNIKLKDLINTFKGFYTDNPITFEQLIDLLTNKKQISGIQRDKTKKYTPQVIDFQRTINISDVSGQNIVVTDKTDKDKTDKDKNVHVIYVDETSIALNEKGRDELSDEQLSSYGIDAVEYDELGNIKTIFFNKDVEISVLKLDGDGIVPFASQQAKTEKQITIDCSHVSSLKVGLRLIEEYSR
ncbi:MAG: hypothetical protein II417_01840, partial [Elusimicrobia bacterium]|nr:hypothetical protein [Elusimicrobiota bacterium]